MKREEYLPSTDPNDPAHQSAQVAIDMVHDFANRDIVYDMWPIDDPIREAALCTISAVQLKGGRTVEKALTKLPLDQKRVLVDTIRSVIEISVDKINHAGDNVHYIGAPDQLKPKRRFDTDEDYRDSIRSYATRSLDSYKADIGKPADQNYGKHPINDMADVAAMAVLSDLRTMNALSEAAWINEETKELIADSAAEIIRLAFKGTSAPVQETPRIENPNALPVMKPFEQTKLVAEAAYWISKDWATRHGSGLGQEERVYGAVHEVLNMIQNGNELYEIPAFQLVPVDPNTESGCVATIDRDGDRVAAEWNFGQPFSPTYHPPGIYGHEAKHPPGSLTYQYQSMYETARERYRTAALDLFGDPSDGY